MCVFVVENALVSSGRQASWAPLGAQEATFQTPTRPTRNGPMGFKFCRYTRYAVNYSRRGWRTCASRSHWVFFHQAVIIVKKWPFLHNTFMTNSQNTWVLWLASWQKLVVLTYRKVVLTSFCYWVGVCWKGHILTRLEKILYRVYVFSTGLLREQVGLLSGFSPDR